MSTKTTFKRIALVAVAALGFGMLSVVPSNAAAGDFGATRDSTGVLTNSATADGIAGPYNSVELTQVASGTATTGYHILATGGTIVSSSANATGSGTASLVVAPNTTVVMTVPTTTAGTIVVKNYAIVNGVESATATATVTITVATAASGTVYSASTIAESFTAPTAGTAFKYTNAATGVTTRIASAAASTADELFGFTVTQKDVAGTSLGTPSTKAVTAVLSGPGSLSIGGTSAVAPYMALPAASANNPIVYVYADGRAGKSTLTIAVNGVTVKSFDFTFWGTKASYKVTANANQIPVNTTTAFTGAYTITALDALGNVVPGAAWVASSSSTATATSATSGTTFNAPVSAGAATPTEFAALGSSDVDVLALAKGSSVFTVANLAVSPTITASATIKVTGAQIATLTWAFNKTVYAPGEKVTVTVTAKDSDANAVGDGNYTLWKSTVLPSASLSTNGLVSSNGAVAAVEALVDGSYTYTFYAPITTGAFTFSGTTATSSDLAVALQAQALSISTEVANAEAQAAIDAAAEATDAANAATDAANAAAEAADAATAAAQDASDAVVALSAQVATLISALRAQLTSLTNLVIKIQKKVKA